MKSHIRIPRNDFETLPAPPFTVYFINSRNEVQPQRLFTVTQKRLTENAVELYIMELKKHVRFNPRRVIPAEQTVN